MLNHAVHHQQRSAAVLHAAKAHAHAKSKKSHLPPPPFIRPQSAVKPVAAPPVPQASLTDERNAVHDYLEAQHALWINKVAQMIIALNLAHDAYKDILEQKTPPSLLGAILEGVLTTLITAAVPGLAGVKAIATMLKKEEKGVEEVVKVVVEVTKVTREAVKKDLETGESAKDAHTASSYAVAFFQEMYVGLSDTLNTVTMVFTRLLDYLNSPTDPMPVRLTNVKSAWKRADLELETRPFDAKQMSLLFLYDLMKGYAQEAVSLKAFIPMQGEQTVSNEKALELIDKGFDIEFEGLDSARRAKMYEYFDGITWWVGDPKRPKIVQTEKKDAWKTLIRQWKFRKE